MKTTLIKRKTRGTSKGLSEGLKAKQFPVYQELIAPVLKEHGANDTFYQPREEWHGVSPHDLITIYSIMVTSREVDQIERTLQAQGQAWFSIAGAGKEAINCAFGYLLSQDDAKLGYYRDRALMLLCGVSVYEMLCQTTGAADDTASHGRQMPSHWGSPALGIPISTSTTGSQTLQAVGLANSFLKRKQLGLPFNKTDLFRRDDAVVYTSIGDGTTSQGEIEETVREAARTHAPFIMVIEDDKYAISVPVTTNVPGGDIFKLYEHYEELGLAVYSVDGTDFLASLAVTKKAVERARRREGGAIIHARVTRPMSHSSTDTQSHYRLPEDLADEQQRDPIIKMSALLTGEGIATAEQLEQIRARALQMVRREAERAIAAPKPASEEFTTFVLAHPPTLKKSVTPATPQPNGASEPHGRMMEMRYGINQTLKAAMTKNHRIVMYGEDIADTLDPEKKLTGKGGVFHVTKDLEREFGSGRVWNSALSEATIVGTAIGYSMGGFLPIVEIQFRDYLNPAMQQLIDEASTMRWRSFNQWKCPMVIRMSYGGYLRGAGAIWHSEAGVGPLSNIPGIRIVVPSNTADAVGLLRTAIESDEIVLYLECKGLYSSKGPYPGEHHRVPFGEARVVREGEHLTIVTYGNCVSRAIEVAGTIAQEGKSVEVIDLRTVDCGWDRATVATSLAKTARVLVLDEDRYTGGFGATIAATIAEEMFEYLDAPPARVSAKDCRVSYGPIGEAAILPQPADILARARHVLSY